MPEPIEYPKIVVGDRPPAARTAAGLRFSLLSLCILVGVACFAAAYWGVIRREREASRRAEELLELVKEQETEIQRLRAELGYITVTDPTKVHVLQLPTREEYRWKWRVYLPKGRWKLFEAPGKIPPSGFDGVSYAMSTVDEGEFLLEAGIDRSSDGKGRFFVSQRGASTTFSIPAEDQKRLESGAVWSSLGSGFQLTILEAMDGPIEFLRLRSNEFDIDGQGNRTSRTAKEPTFGYLIWIERAGPGE